jgi:hypothetical protein
VSIRIPPVDNGKFINPLAPGQGRECRARFAGPKTAQAGRRHHSKIDR